MSDSPLIHPRLMRELRNHHNSLCTIEINTEVQDPNSGEETTTYRADPLMTAIRCYVEAQTRREIRRPDQTIVENAFVIQLAGYYPRIDVEDHAIILGATDQVHNILGVSHDDTQTITYLDTEIINDDSDE